MRVREGHPRQDSQRLLMMIRKLSPFLKTAWLIRYVAIALIITGYLDKQENRLTLGVGLLLPTKLEKVDQGLEKANSKT
ncbi:hypothetical protein [Stenomitos frigidus]|uniref:Uncharacterized protein n=2 Tax=Stenomitos TaxID=1844270 RepID=A0A2T1EB43_9CYAN|nr:hypothetical protein C7B82_10190 [Stenomitos frigidus ULC18]